MTDIINVTRPTRTPRVSGDAIPDAIQPTTYFGLSLKTIKRATVALGLAGSFLAGRAYGWYEAHLYMKHVAESLAQMVGNKI